MRRYETAELSRLQRAEPWIRARFERKFDANDRVDVTARIYEAISCRLDRYTLQDTSTYTD
jgi:hypothetical protein